MILQGGEMKKGVCILAAMAIFTGVAQSGWVTAYYAGWTKWNSVSVDETMLDYSCATHWIAFNSSPPSWSLSGSGWNNTRLTAFSNGAHAAGAKAIMGTGGWGSDYTQAVNSESARSSSINALMNIVRANNMDGVDIDWEPVPSSQATNFGLFVRQLRDSLKAFKADAELTAACFSFDQVVVNNRQYFDQLNLMTYDMSGTWTGVSWHNSAIYSGGGNTGSIDKSIDRYLAAGVPASQLGFGIELYAYIWNGVNAPLMTGFGTIKNTVPYYTVMRDYYARGVPFVWDAQAQAGYFSDYSQFVSMDFETTMVAKANYLKSKGLGGVIIYEAGVGWVPEQNPPDRIMKSAKYAFLNGPALPPLPHVDPPPPPEKNSYVVYDDRIHAGFWSTSWLQRGFNPNATDPVNSSNTVISAGYGAWDGLRFHTGSTWGNQTYIASDSLIFDVYPKQSFTATIVAEGGGPVTRSFPTNKWTRVSVPLPSSQFRWFYIQNNTSNLIDAFFDNIMLRESGSAPTGIAGDGTQPQDFELDQNYPNPFNPSTTISYALPGSTHVELSVYDVVGQHVATLVQGYQEAGKHTVAFAPENLAGGVYFYKLTSNARVLVKKMILLK
jgi:hypothetical protein